MIGILNYGMGNTQSVYNAFRFLGVKVEYRRPNEISDLDALVFPGVGAFRDTAALLRPCKNNLKDFLNSGKPFLGICIGLQYLFEESLENGRWQGIGFFKGPITKLPAKKLPQIGWNKLNIKKKTPLLKNIPTGCYVYYINSYAAENTDAFATSNYGKEFAAVVGSGNVFATQFHPEKSGEIGLKILKNFIRVTKQCL
jgi:glutamine amidotransferase